MEHPLCPTLPALILVAHLGGQNYNGIDRILKGLLSCYETPYQDLDPSQVVAQALCNLRWALTRSR
jgi:hypothetical protein